MGRWSWAGVTLLWTLTLLGMPGRARAQNPPGDTSVAPTETLQLAKQHFVAGKDAYNAGKYAQAIREFKAAEAIRPSPILSYNIGLSNEKLGKRRLALQYYQSYLSALPDAANRAEVQERVAKLQAQPAQTTTAADTPPPTYPPYAGGDPYASSAPAQPQPPPPAPAAKKSLWWVWVLVGVGGGLVLTTIIVIAAVYASSSSPTADHAGNQPLVGHVPLPVENASRAAAPTVPVLTFHF